ncbi:MAG: UDP-N-acetylmuramoyl-L-alanyl-D-glutamate--2,6-diaminopimelate ligase [Ktedonobacterales bacterium]
MEKAELIAAVHALEVRGLRTGDISAVTYNSREVSSGACFVAIRGKWTDGHTYIPDALARGATLVVGDIPPPEDFPPYRTYLRVENPRRALGTLAAAFYRYPSHRMAVIGVTGTDGKTTTANLIEAMLAAAGRHTGLMSTVEFKIGATRRPNNTRFTTLEAPEVQAVLAEMVTAGVECAVVETTSSGLELHRVEGVEYDVAVLTNITSEHLEVHGTWENYRRAKAMLFERVDPERAKPEVAGVPGACVLNADDPSCAYLRSFCRAPVLTYGIEQIADVRGEDIHLGADGTRFRALFPDGTVCDIHTPLVARFNVSNCLAALTVGYVCGLSPEVMARALSDFPGVSGRMERIDEGQPFTVIVDYAHTAESLEKVLEVLRPLTSGRLMVVFGSAGDRDRVKRPHMGAVAARLADFAVITDEDPREEDAESILREIAAGAFEAGGREGEQFTCIVGRRAGIARAFALAGAGDTVLLAGKGHEQSIFIGREKLPWDDRRVAREELAALGYRHGPIVGTSGFPPTDVL